MACDVSQVNLVLVAVFDHLDSRVAAFAQPALVLSDSVGGADRVGGVNRTTGLGWMRGARYGSPRGSAAGADWHHSAPANLAHQRAGCLERDGAARRVPPGRRVGSRCRRGEAQLYLEASVMAWLCCELSVVGGGDRLDD